MSKSAKLVKLLEQNPQVRDELLAVLQGDGGTAPAPAPVPTSPTEAAIFAKLMLEAVQQIADSTAEQTKAIGRIGKTVEFVEASGRNAREWKRIGKNATDAGKMLLVGGAIASSSLLVLVVLTITVKNALVDVISNINPFDGKPEQQQVLTGGSIESPPLLEGGAIAGLPITSGFGYRIHPITGNKRHHDGVDFAMRVGTALYAPAAVEVRCLSDPQGYGTYAVFEVESGRDVLLGHLSGCTPGKAAPGQQIALSGNSGGSTGAHLHFEEEVDGKAVQPSLNLALATIKGIDYKAIDQIVSKLFPAIVGQESGGDHTAESTLGALGKTQVMPSNIPTWSAEALGKPLSVDEFVNDPSAQRQISLYRMSAIAAEQFKATGDIDAAMRRVAAVWYSGNADRESDYSPLPNKSGPSVGQYVDEVMGRIQ